MGPPRKSRSVNKRFSYGDEISPTKDGDNTNKKNQRKKKLSDMLGSHWSKEELEHFYEAYRKHGKDWRKVAAVLRNRTAEMVEAVYSLNKAYLSLPEGTASVVGFIAMMTDYYSNMEDGDGEHERNDGVETSRNPQKRLQRKVHETTSKGSVERFRSHLDAVPSDYGCLSVLKKKRTGGSRPRAVGKRTPRFPVSHSYENIKGEKHFLQTRKGLKLRGDNDDDDVAHSIAMALAEASKRGGSPQVSQTPNRRSDSLMSSPCQSAERMYDESDVASGWFVDNGTYDDDIEGSMEADNTDFSRDKSKERTNAGYMLHDRKGSHGKKVRVDRKENKHLDYIREACSGTEEQNLGTLRRNFDVEVTDAKPSRPSSQGSKRRSKEAHTGRGPNLALVANNYHLVPTNFNCQCPVIVEILKRHALNQALTANPLVPAVYVHQLWRSFALVARCQHFDLRTRIGNSDITLTCSIFRTILGLPAQEAFDAQVTDETLSRELQALGYRGGFHQLSSFTRTHLQPVWYTLFTILNRCLSAVTKGIDRTSVNMLRLFHAVIYSRNVDYAAMLWTELVAQVQKKVDGNRRLSFLPYPRFLQMIVAHYLETDPTIPRRADHEVLISTRMTRIQNIRVLDGVVPMIIPADLLAIADQTTLSVIAYRTENNLVAPMDQPGPAGPALGARSEQRERPRMRGRGVRPAGAVGRGEQRENIVRGSGVGSDGRSSREASTSRPRPQTPPSLGIKGSALHDVEVEGVSRAPPTEEATSSNSSESGSSSRSDKAQLPPVSRSENSGVERRDQPPPVSTSLYALSSLEPLVTELPLARTQVIETAIVESLSASTGTPGAIIPFGSSQGQGGSPTTATITPTVNVGGTAVQFAAGTSTKWLSAAGVSFPEFVSKEYVDDALKVVQSDILKQVSEDLAYLRRFVTGKSVASSVPPPTPQLRLSQQSTTPNVQQMSVDDLKAALLSKLLSESDVSASANADLVSILRSQSQTPPPTTPIDSAQLSEMTKALEKLTERVSSFEDTCKGQVQSSKRRHDDQDDPDQHEGEKRLKLTEPSSAATETATVTPAEPQPQQQSGSEMVQDKEISTPVRDSLAESTDLTVEKPEGQSD